MESAKGALEAAEKARTEAQKGKKREEAVLADIAKEQEAVCTLAKEAAEEISRRIQSMETMKTSAIKSALTKVKTLRRFQRQKTRQYRKMKKAQRMRKKSVSRAFTEKGAQMRLLKLQGKLDGLATQDHRLEQELQNAAKAISELESTQKELQAKGLDEGKREVLTEMARLSNENSSLIKRIAGIEEGIANTRGRWDQYLEVAAANWRVYTGTLRERIETLRTEKPDLFGGKETKAELRIQIQKETKRLGKIQKHIITTKRNIKKVTQDTSSGGERTKMRADNDEIAQKLGTLRREQAQKIKNLPANKHMTKLIEKREKWQETISDLKRKIYNVQERYRRKLRAALAKSAGGDGFETSESTRELTDDELELMKRLAGLRKQMKWWEKRWEKLAPAPVGTQEQGELAGVSLMKIANRIRLNSKLTDIAP